MNHKRRYTQRTTGSANSASSQSVGRPDGQPPLPVEALQDLLGGLVREREELRARRAHPAELERNRLAIVRAQWELAHALIERHAPQASAA
jgi:hypothetical protein